MKYLFNLCSIVRDRLKNGIDKLSEANASVSVLQKQLVSLGPEIEEKTIETEKTLALLKVKSLICSKRQHSTFD